jgi:hypothetical protein
MHRPVAILLVIPLAVAACTLGGAPATSPPGPTAPSPTATATSGPTTAPSPVVTAAPRATPPPGTTAWPKAFDIEMTGTYWSSPPFTIAFAITIDEPGWFSGHLHPEFTDLQRFDGMTQHQFPNLLLGFGDPEHIRGNDGDVDVAGLTPDTALDLLAARASLTTANRAAVELFGLTGARLDIHTATGSNPIFGGPAGNFGLGPELDIRLVLLPLGGRLLVVLVSATTANLDAAWEQALPLLETVALAS